MLATDADWELTTLISLILVVFVRPDDSRVHRLLTAVFDGSNLDVYTVRSPLKVLLVIVDNILIEDVQSYRQGLQIFIDDDTYIVFDEFIREAACHIRLQVEVHAGNLGKDRANYQRFH